MSIAQIAFAEADAVFRRYALLLENGRCQWSIHDGIMYLGTMFFDPIVGTPIARFDPDASSLLGEETMFYVASIYRHVRTVRITAESLEEMSCGQGWQPGTIVESAQSQLEIDTKLVVDRLLRECFTQNSSRGMGRTDIS